MPSQRYAHELIRRAIERRACIVVMREAAALVRAVPQLCAYPIITANSMQNATVSPGNITRFNELRDALR